MWITELNKVCKRCSENTMLRPIIQPRMKEAGKENIKSPCSFYIASWHISLPHFPLLPPHLLSGFVLFNLFFFSPLFFRKKSFSFWKAGTITLTTTILLSTDDNNEKCQRRCESCRDRRITKTVFNIFIRTSWCTHEKLSSEYELLFRWRRLSLEDVNIPAAWQRSPHPLCQYSSCSKGQ